MPDAVTVILPVHNAADRVRACVAEWYAYLGKIGRESTLVVVDDGSTDDTPAALRDLSSSFPKLIVITHDTHRGYGASLRSAVGVVSTPLLCYADVDPAYKSHDLGMLLKRIEEPADVYGTQKLPDAASGCRVGQPVPAMWRRVGWCYRWFCRLALGVPLEPLPGWLGFKEHARGWVVWVVMGVPLLDVNSRFKVIRRAMLDKFPIQSDSDFVHAELFGKLTFLASVVAEEPLTPSTTPVVASWWGDFWRAFSNVQFHPQLPDLRSPPAPPPEVPPPTPA
jgi:glycosyltransferase involved in cell wall biosynthesis